MTGQENEKPETCFEVLMKYGYNLSGYSMDTIFNLQTSHGSIEECETFLALLERQYG